VVANLGWDNVKLRTPVRIGDTLRAKTLILSKRESRSRPHTGIVRFATKGLNQHGEVVVSFERTILVYKRGFGPRFPASSRLG
jgi:acyl dehydratase